MSDLISKQAAREALLKKGQSSKRYKLGETWELNWLEIEDALSSIPIMETEPVKLGEWVDVKFSEGVYKDNDDSNDIGLSITSAKCSFCQRYSERLQQYSPTMPAYCQHCGAKMDGGADND